MKEIKITTVQGSIDEQIEEEAAWMAFREKHHGSYRFIIALSKIFTGLIVWPIVLYAYNKNKKYRQKNHEATATDENMTSLDLSKMFFRELKLFEE